MYENLVVPNFLRISKDAEGHRGLFCKSDSLTRQEFLQMSKISSIIAKYKTTGMVEQRMRGDVPFELQTRPDLSDFQQLHNYVCDLRHREDLKVAGVSEGDSVLGESTSVVAEGVIPSETKANPSSGEQNVPVSQVETA